MELLDALNAPSREFTPVPFWFLNGDLEAGEIRRQMEDFCAHGVTGVVLHPRMGLSDRIGYLSPEFFSCLRAAIETAAELNMRVVLYDEGMYPSGSAGGKIVRENPELASRGLGVTHAPLPGDKRLCLTEKGWLVERFSGGTIRGLHFGEDDGEPNAPPSADILNPQAVKRFIELTHEAYWREFSAYFGSVIIGFFTDEPSILGRNTTGLFPWTAGFDAAFTAAGGRLENLQALFSGGENDDTRLYHRLILEREGEVYYAALSRWCEKHGVALMGHPHQSDDIEVQRFFHVPGQDLVFRWVSPEGGGVKGMDSVMGKCSADAARLMGRRRNSNECFGACNRENNPWHFTGGDMKWYIDWLAVRGVNLFIPHAFYYSLEGKRSMERPPDVGPGSIWWPHYRQWAVYMARLSFLMTDAELKVDIAVPCRNRDMRPETAAALFETQRGFQYLPQSVWSECREENGALVCRGMRFSAAAGMEDFFPGVSHDFGDVPPDCTCDPPQPLLRCARFTRRGRECWLLVNEGEQALDFTLTLPTAAPVMAYDLWRGEAFRASTPGRLRLGRRESVLLIACENQREWDALPERMEPREISPVFTLKAENKAAIQKTYAASVGSMDEDAILTLRAEEMAELYVNGDFTGVSFWNPHRIFIPRGRLDRPENTLELKITGSKANRYGKPVYFGLEEERKQ